MTQEQKNKESKKPNKKGSKTFDIKLLPMDIARFFMTVAYPFLRLKKYDLNGKPYHLKCKGAVITSNHLGFSDPPLMAAAFFYRRTFMITAESVMKNRFVAFLLRQAGCIKIDRNASDIDAIRRSVEALKDGRLLLIFPQGKIVRTDEVDSVKSGAALIAAQADVPIIPVYAGKRHSPFSFRRIVVGEPIYCKDYQKRRFATLAELEQISDIMQERIEECHKTFDEIERKIYNDR